MKAILIFDMPLDENDEYMTVEDIRKIEYIKVNGLNQLWVHYKKQTERGNDFTYSNNCKFVDQKDIGIYPDGKIGYLDDTYDTQRELIEDILGGSI